MGLLVLVDRFRQTGVTPQLLTIYLLLRSRNFIFGGSVVTSTIPVDLLELKARFESWRTNRKYVREPIPDELWNAAADLSRRHPTSLVGRILKLDPGRLKKLLMKRSARTFVRKKPQSTSDSAPDDGLATPRLSDRGPNSRRLRRERVAFFC
jgi:hypothetical protein